MASAKEEPKESGIITTLRNYMMGHGGLAGADNKAFDVAMGVDDSSGTAKGYAYGGRVDGGIDLSGLDNVPIPPSSYDIGTSGSTPVKTMGNIPPPPPMATPAPMAAMPPVSRETPPAAAPSFGAPAAPPRPPLPGLADILGSARGAGASVYGDFTPEKRNELYAYMAQRQNAMPSVIGGALAGVGDAITRGYGARDSNFLDKTLDAQGKTREEAVGAFDAAQKGKMGELSAGMEFEKMDPHSSISKVTREAYAPLLQKLGYGPQALSNMSAANVESAAKVAAEYGGKEMENLFHQAQLIVEGQFHKQELGVRETEQKNKALEQLASHPIASFLPTDTNRALKATAGLAGGAGAPTFAPDVVSYAQSHNITPAQAQALKQKRLGGV